MQTNSAISNFESHCSDVINDCGSRALVMIRLIKQVSMELRKWVYSQQELSRRKRHRADLRGTEFD